MKVKNNIWFTSDTHYGHKNIVRGESKWGEFRKESSHQSTRDFDTVSEHNDALVANINKLVKPDDIMYHLGDWSFGGGDNVPLFRSQINCRNIHFIYGNHDGWIRRVYSKGTDYFLSCQDVLYITIKIGETETGKHIKQKFFMSHFSHRVWDQSHHGVIHLYGHSHGSLAGLGRSMDVGVDTNNLKPYHLDEILDRMSKVEVSILDHHNEGTN